MAKPSGRWLHLRAVDVMREPDNLPEFAAYNYFHSRQDALDNILSASVVRVRLASGAVLRIQPQATRPWTSLSAGFWLLAGFGVLAFLIAAGVWASSDDADTRTPVRLLGLSGTGFILTAISSAIYIERELALDPVWFHPLELVNQAGILLFAIAGSAMLWCYPRRLTRFPLHWAMLAAGALVWLNLLVQWRNLPIHNVYIPLFTAYLLAVGLSLVQWRRTRGDPLARAALKWLMLSIFLTTGVALLLFFVPVVFGGRPLSSAVATGGIGLLMFIGLAAGVLRYRLFDLERWWLDIWLWFGAAVAVLGMDALFVFALGVIPLRAFGLAIIIVGWLYIPLRGRLWKTFRSDSNDWWDQHLPVTLEEVFSAPNRAAFLQRWRHFLHRTFRPLDTRTVESEVKGAVILGNGVCLRVPPLGAGPAVDLLYQQRGTRLFTREDARLADTFVALATRSLHAFEARERGVARERERIMRDLHDDVGASLLTLSRRCDEPKNAALAGRALETLRDVVHSMTLDAERTLPEAVADWRIKVVTQLEDAGVEFGWHVNVPLPEVPLSGRQYVHIGRILQEAVSNLLKHAAASHATFDFAVNEGVLRLRVANDGVKPGAAGVGRGLKNIAARAAELNGRVDHRVEGEKFVLCLKAPLTKETEEHATRAAG
ncbi:MAG TPA: hypothetical protein VFK45_12285 [Gammaproteobacteria bacterium]|nr:hypothetical protein [Gammaproteobacteria bacterium]